MKYDILQAFPHLLLSLSVSKKAEKDEKIDKKKTFKRFFSSFLFVAASSFNQKFHPNIRKSTN